MATFEALFSDGTHLILEADRMKVDDGLVVFEQDMDGSGGSVVCVLGGDDLVGCFDTRATYAWQEEEEEDEEEEE